MIKYILNLIFNKNFKNLITAYDGTEVAYSNKLLFEGFSLSYGINVIDCGICNLSILSSVISDIKADIGVLFFEKEINIIDKDGLKLDLNQDFIEKEIKTKKWNEIGILEKREIFNIYYKKVFNEFKIKKQKKHIILNLNFSPLSLFAPYIFRNIFEKVTTLNSTVIQTYRIDFQKSILDSLNLLKSYNAEICFITDQKGEKIKILFEDKIVDSYDIFEHSVKYFKKINKKLFNIYILNNQDFKIKESNLNFQIIKSISSEIINEKSLIFDFKRNSVIYSKISKWFDPIVTFISWYTDRFIY